MATAFRFKHGNYVTTAGSARPVSMSITPREINTFHTSHIYDIQVELWISQATPAAFIAEIDLLIAALKVPRVDSGIQFTTDGSSWYSTSHFCYYADSMMGPNAKVVSVPSGPLQYVTEQYVQVTIQAEYPNAELSPLIEILRFEETLEFIGNGKAKTVLRPRHTLKSIRQQVREFTDVRVIQTGLIVGRYAYPSLPSPLIVTAGALQAETVRDRKSKKQIGTADHEFHRAYSYEYTLNEHPDPDDLEPNLYVPRGLEAEDN